MSALVSSGRAPLRAWASLALSVSRGTKGSADLKLGRSGFVPNSRLEKWGLVCLAEEIGREVGTISAAGWPQPCRKAGQVQHGRSHWLSNERIAPSTIGHALEAGLADSK